MQTQQSRLGWILVQGIAVLFVWIAVGAGLTFADTWYVRVTGDDSHDCVSPQTACATLHAAVEKALRDGHGAGDTIYVGAGTYVTPTTEPRKEGIRIVAGQGGTASAPFQLIADTEGSHTGDAGVVEVVGGKNGFVLGASFVTLEGFTIRHPTGVSGVFVSGANEGIVLHNLEVFGAPHHGITLQTLPAGAPHHIAKKMLAGLAPREAVVEGLMKAPQLVEETLDITLCKRKGGRRQCLAYGPTCG